MLTKQDLGEFRKIIREEVHEEVTVQLKPLKKDVAELKADVSILKIDVAALKTDVSGIKKDIVIMKKDITQTKKDIVQIRKDQKLITNFFDREYLDLRERVERIERHLGLPTNTI